MLDNKPSFIVACLGAVFQRQDSMWNADSHGAANVVRRADQVAVEIELVDP